MDRQDQGMRQSGGGTVRREAGVYGRLGGVYWIGGIVVRRLFRRKTWAAAAAAGRDWGPAMAEAT